MLTQSLSWEVWLNQLKLNKGKGTVNTCLYRKRNIEIRKMKKYTIDQIISKVRTKLDEIAVNESEMIGTEEDNANLNMVIQSCVPEAYRFISLNAHPNMLEGKQYASGALTIGKDLVGKIGLPGDFLRLLSVRLSSWISSCSVFVDEDSPEYRMQSNQWVSGNKYKPVAALVQTGTGRQVELFKASSTNDELKSFIYIPVLADNYSEVDLSDQTADAFIYYVAALTMVTFREDVANQFFSVARNLLGLE